MSLPNCPSVIIILRTEISRRKRERKEKRKGKEGREESKEQKVRGKGEREERRKIEEFYSTDSFFGFMCYQKSQGKKDTNCYHKKHICKTHERGSGWKQFLGKSEEKTQEALA